MISRQLLTYELCSINKIGLISIDMKLKKVYLEIHESDFWLTVMKSFGPLGNKVFLLNSGWTQKKPQNARFEWISRLVAF